VKLVEGALIGVAIGWLQLVAWPERPPRSWIWVVGSSLGWAFAWGYGWGLTRQVFGDYDLVYLILGGLAGFGAGLIQLLLLFRYTRHAGVWLVGSTLGWAAGSALGVLIPGMLGWPIGGAVAGLITGLTLVWLLKPAYSAQAS
ncbi:MAG: hypothetical protein R3264_21675, partial [Anaerolineae bacterium]|nr:hypothetical protein [Anaerolineae bacterium]